MNNPQTMSAVHEYLHRLCQGTSVRYGPVICAPAGQLAAWMGRRMDWWGLDAQLFPRYLRADGTIDEAAWLRRMAGNWLVWQELARREWPVVKICETGALHDRNRAAWFTLQAGWLARHKGDALLTYWRRGGNVTGAWPPGAGVVRTLRNLTLRYGRADAGS